MSIQSRTAQLLEFPKVLAALASGAVSEPGAAACLALGPLPHADAVAAETRLAELAAAWLRDTRFSLSPFPDLEGLFDFTARDHRPLDQDALFALAQVLGQARLAREGLTRLDGGRQAELAEVLLAFPWPERTASALNRCLDPEGRIRDESSPELYAVRGEIRSIHQKCTKKVKEVILGHDLSHYLQDEFITLSSDRYVLPLKANFKGRLDGIIHDYSQTGETCYFEPLFLVELNNRLQELKNEEKHEERKILEYLTGLCNAERDAVRAAYDFLVRLDVLQAKAALGARLHGCAVAVEPGPVRLMQARHPLLALSAEGAHPVDLKLDPEHRALVVSGGNAGGKTVCLKTLGCIALMAYSALPAPVAEGSRLPFFGRLFVIMGDEQSLEDQVSTFTAQIRYVARVWDQVDDGALFLLDEFGAGTDPAQGAALAQAVLESLMERGATVCAATHFPALKAYALAAERIRSASVLFDPSTRRPLFDLAYDQAGASIALEVARDNGLPREILARAEQNLLLEGSDTGSIMDRLNALAVQRRDEVAGLEQERRKLRQKRAGLEERFERERAALLDEIKDQAQAVVRQWQQDRIGRKQAQTKLSGLRERLTGLGGSGGTESAEDAPARTLTLADVAVGDRLRYAPWGKVGVAMERDEKRGQVKFDLDGVAMWVAVADLEPVDGPAPKARPASSGLASPAGERGFSLRLDLRGRRADVALAELERFLDDAILKGAGTLEIVHGRGTGALRREVHEYLKRFPAVERFAVANEDHGGDGMTEVVLK
ncbi:MAG: endonuclease MutS2 [Desulfovibrionaceae bacterium]